MARTKLELENDGHQITIRLDGNVPSISVLDDRGDVAVRITTQSPPGGASPSASSVFAVQQTTGQQDLLHPTTLVASAAMAQAVEDSVKPRVDINGRGGSITLAGLVEETAPVDPHADVGTGAVIRKVKVRLALDGENGAIELGGNDVIGDLRLQDATGGVNVRIRGNGEVTLGGQGTRGRLALKRATGGETIRLNAEGGDVTIGGQNTDGDLRVLGSDGSLRIHLKGDDGDIILSNADFAEDFDVAEPIEAGTVVVLDESRGVRPSTRPYDHAVVGVIAGAGDCKPAIIADRRAGATGRQAVSLLGKVYCKVEADETPISVGDLLTTSSVPGHAMKVRNPLDALGALVGKALAPLATGRALVPILVLVR